MNSFAATLGLNTSKNKTCFLCTTGEGMAVLVNGKEYFLRYADFPWFEYCQARELRDVTADRWGVYWDAVGIDLPIEALENPGKFPVKVSVESWLKARSRNAARILGQVRTERKAAASRSNGTKGGRPRKQEAAPAPTTNAETSHEKPYKILSHLINNHFHYRPEETDVELPITFSHFLVANKKNNRNLYVDSENETDWMNSIKVAACTKAPDGPTKAAVASLGRRQKQR